MSSNIITRSARSAFAATQRRAYSAPAERAVPANKQKYVPTSGSYPKGFLVGSAFAGVKASNTHYEDMALIVSEEPCSAAAVFTRNAFQAAPVQASRRIISQSAGNTVRGVVINSGCANAVTGKAGMEDALLMATTTDKCFGNGATNDQTPESPQTLVMSTGVIGQKLPIDRIVGTIPKLYESLGSSHEHWLRAANAICTTDTFPKLISRTFTLPSHPETTYTIAGMTKGAGMIHPNMGTLLGVVCTDVRISAGHLRSFLKDACRISFNSISIDGDTSTNDTVAFFANGAAAPEGDASTVKFLPNKMVTEVVDAAGTEDTVAFKKVLQEFFTDLAKLVVRDGEGATKFVTVRVRSEVSVLQARRAAVSIATSALVKTALYGKDANWGRILCAIGYAPGIISTAEVPAQFNSPFLSPVDPHGASVSFKPADGSEELKLLVNGEPQQIDEARAKQILEMEDIEIVVNLARKAKTPTGGKLPRTFESVYYTCDLSHEYVTINGDYRT